MSSKSKGKNHKDVWQNSVASFVLRHDYNGNAYGIYWTPQYGNSIQRGEDVIYGSCGMGIIDPSTIQGNRIVKDIEIRASLLSSLTPVNSYVVVLYKYNSAYGGTPVPDIDPVANEPNSRPSYAYVTIANYPNILGTCVIQGNSTDEHIIRYDGEVILESSDEIRIIYGNLIRWGSIEHEGDEYTKVPTVLEGTTILTGTAKCAVAYL